MFSIVQLDKYTVPSNYSESVSISLGSGTIVSVGFQNMGNQQYFWASQMFVQSPTQAYWEVVNTEGSSVDWYPTLVIYHPDGGAQFSAGNVTAESSQTPLRNG